jgi:L-ascorbate metabolism protein UlaG (beta-lactamase superfamily)
MNRIEFLRHATLWLHLDGCSLLTDPMLLPKEGMEPIPNAGNDRRIPLIDLPLSEEALQELIHQTDALLITHLHRDHWDSKAQQIVPKNKLIFCQPPDEPRLREQGFTEVIPIDEALPWQSLTLYRTGGQHGRGEIGRKMAPVSGFVLKGAKEVVYIAGDTIWCTEVQEALNRYEPTHTIVNAGAAEFLTGGPITMTAADVQALCAFSPHTRVIAVHMDAINHCWLTKEKLNVFLQNNALSRQVCLPKEGEIIYL